ncbi:hypothetical protein N657DRAFT_685399 [Parathielavia appendiculata]|uniref:Uncharacterized protein n=1 Tax=Parathielavia appendiculata TaxID=2587402 RepID=A0AAN6TPB8_9PEZI|nr:hypothetical protein N657DRAFT_685399 [Parathielavia appendiculata]
MEGHRGEARLCLNQYSQSSNKPLPDFLLRFGLMTSPGNHCAFDDADDQAFFSWTRTVNSKDLNAHVLTKVCGITIHETTQSAYYPGDITEEEISMPPNGRGSLRLAYGDHSVALQHIHEQINQAMEYAANDLERDLLRAYNESFQTGSLDMYRESQRIWYNDIRQECGFKNVIIANRMGIESRARQYPFIDASEVETFAKQKFPAHYWWVVLHELLGHGTGQMMVECEEGKYNLDINSPPMNPLTGNPITS